MKAILGMNVKNNDSTFYDLKMFTNQIIKKNRMSKEGKLSKAGVTKSWLRTAS